MSTSTASPKDNSEDNSDFSNTNNAENYTAENTLSEHMKKKNHPVMIDQGTSTEPYSNTNPHRCKYCTIRLTKLRLLDKAKYRQMTDGERNIAASKLKTNQCIDRAIQTSSWQYEAAEMTPKEIRSMALVMRFRNSSGGKPLKSETFCKCVLQGKEKDCRCGEDEQCKFTVHCRTKVHNSFKTLE